MATQFRLYTENKNRRWIQQLVGCYFPNFTMYQGRGCWKEGSEPALIIEVISTKDLNRTACLVRLERIAGIIKRVNKQEAILLTETKLKNSQLI